jgi:hypothetical protein
LKPQFLLVEALHRLFEGTSEEAEQLVQGILERCQALVFLAEVSSTFFSSSDHPPLYWAASVMRHSLPNLLPPAAARFQHPLHSKTWLWNDLAEALYHCSHRSLKEGSKFTNAEMSGLTRS